VSYRDVLLVEDEPALRNVIARNLGSRGVRVREAATAAEAIAATTEEVPQLLLLDLNLPDRTGWDVLRDLSRRHVSVPTVIVSAVRVNQSRLEEFHPLAYLPKPFPIEALLRIVIGGKASAASGNDRPDRPQHPPSPPSPSGEGVSSRGEWAQRS
jgi:DNA-binding response OmpR family regulator